MIEINREDLAWAAGLFEGEGSVYLGITGTYKYPSLKLCTTDKDVIERFHRVVFKLGAIYGPYKYEVVRTPIWSWETKKFEHIQCVLTLFWGWLGNRRRRKVYEVLSTMKKAYAKRCSYPTVCTTYGCTGKFLAKGF